MVSLFNTFAIMQCMFKWYDMGDIFLILKIEYIGSVDITEGSTGKWWIKLKRKGHTGHHGSSLFVWFCSNENVNLSKLQVYFRTLQITWCTWTIVLNSSPFRWFQSWLSKVDEIDAAPELFLEFSLCIIESISTYAPGGNGLTWQGLH